MAYPATPIEPLIAACERIYARYGFVKWSEVGEELGVSRQAVHSRLKWAVESGRLAQADLDRYRSSSSRTAASRRNARATKELEKLQIRTKLTPENLNWIRTECEVRKVTSADIINGLITKARNQATHGGTSPQP